MRQDEGMVMSHQKKLFGTSFHSRDSFRDLCAAICTKSHFHSSFPLSCFELSVLRDYRFCTRSRMGTYTLSTVAVLT